MRRNRGITLVALVITIIILLILAGVTISMVMGEDGIIAKASKAAKAYEISQYDEELNMIIMQMQANKIAEKKTLDMATLIKELPENIQEIQETTDYEWDTTQTKEEPEGKYKGYAFYVDANFKAHIRDKASGITITCEVTPSGYTNSNVSVMVKINSEDGIKQITFEDGDILKCNGKKQVAIDAGKNIETNIKYTYEVEDMLGNKETKIAQIVNIDKLVPKTAQMELSNTDEWLKIKVTAEDADATDEYASSGIDKYEYYVGTQLKQTSTENECILTGITEDTGENIYVKVYDKAGNVKESNKILNLKISEINYLLIKRNTTNTINIPEIQNINYEIIEKTTNIELVENQIIANQDANTSDSCKIKITGTYNGQGYTNTLTVLVEPESTTVQDKDGNQKEAYAIQTEQDLIRLQEIVTLGIKTDSNAKLMQDIELNKGKYTFDTEGKIVFDGSQKNYNSIGTKDIPYEGIFDGDGKTISGLYIEQDNMIVGMFGVIAKNAEVKNLTLKNSYLKGTTVGGLMCYNEGTVYRCKVEKSTVEITSMWGGGIAGVNNGEIIECCVLDGYLIGQWIGGISGINGATDSRLTLNYNYNEGKIYRCYTTGYIGGEQAATIASHNGVYGGKGYIYDCYSTAELGGEIWETMSCSSIVRVQSYQGQGGYIYNSYYLNPNCNITYVVHPKYGGVIENSYSNPQTITAEMLNNGDRDVWVDGEHPILKWQLEN